MKPWEMDWEYQKDNTIKPWEMDWRESQSLGDRVANDIKGSLATFADSYGFGVPTKIGGALNATFTAPYDWFANDKTRKERYDEFIDEIETAKSNYQKNNPIQSLVPMAAGILTNPANKAGAAYIVGKSPIKSLKDVAKLTGRSSVVGGGLALAEDISKGETNIEKLLKDIGMSAGVAAFVAPAFETAGMVKNFISKGIKEAPKKVGAFIDQKLYGVLGNTSEEIDNFIKKISSGAVGNEATIGTEAKKIAENAIKSINDAIRNKYESAKQFYNKEGLAYIDNIVSTIKSLQKEYLPKSDTGKFLAKQLNKLKGGPTVEQLLGFKQELGDLFQKGEAYALAKEKLGRIYHAANKDYFRSMLKNAYSGRGAEAVRITKSADKSFEFMHKPGGIIEKMKFLANPKKAEGTVGSNIMGQLTTNRSNARSIKALERFADSTPLKEATRDFIRSQKSFNALSPQGKKFVYGKYLDEAENFFNNSMKDNVIKTLQNGADKTSQLLDALGVDARYTPYIQDLAKKLLFQQKK